MDPMDFSKKEKNKFLMKAEYYCKKVLTKPQTYGIVRKVH
jgi:hypothetical protein